MTRTSHSKYEPLERHLKNLPASQDRLTLSFKEVEDIIGISLPESSNKYRAWWANQSNVKNRPQAASWINAGFIVGNVRQERGSSEVIFIRYKLVGHDKELVESDAVVEFFGKEAREVLTGESLEAIRQALVLFSFIEKEKISLAPAFQPILNVLDSLASTLILQPLRDRLPSDRIKQDIWFSPDLSSLPEGRRHHYERLVHSLRKGILYNRLQSPLGRFRDCLDYALNEHRHLDGIFDSVKKAFNFSGAHKLLSQIDSVNKFRNHYIAHNDGKPLDQEKARKALKEWGSALVLISACLKQMG